MSTSIPPSTLEKFTTFGDLLRFLRRRAGITQIELSIAVGYSHPQISRLEQNLRQPDIPTIEARFLSPLLLDDQPQAVARLLELAARVRGEDAPAPGLCPYKGLSYFDEADADLYVGREALTTKLMERLLTLAANGEANGIRFLAIVGASGSGKSSLMRAGLLPALRWHKATSDWPVLVLTPTSHPIESLATALTKNLASVAATAVLMDDLRQDPRSLDLYVKRDLQNSEAHYQLLVVDQFEELFSLCRSEEDRQAFIENLLTATSAENGQAVVVISMRADFYAHCAAYPQLREALARHQEYIGAMSEEERRRAVEEPARRRHWELEPGLADLILHEVSREPGALPLLSHALMETWQRRHGHTLTLSGYTASGGVSGAIAETAETVFTDQLNTEQKSIARRIFLRLTELGDETASGDTGRRATFQELVRRPEESTATQTVLKMLADARLITTGEDSVQVAHEALIRGWPTLRSWLEENREGFRLHRNLTEAAEEWLALEREPGLLYRGARLAQAQEWAISHSDDLNMQELEFLQASIALKEKEAAEREAQRQRELEAAQRLAETQTQAAIRLRRRSVYLMAALGMAAILAALAVSFGQSANQNALQASRNLAAAEQQARLASSRELAAAATNNVEADPQLSILLALEALKRADTSEAQNALHRGILAFHLIATIPAHDQDVSGIAVSPDGSKFASAGVDGTLKIWPLSYSSDTQSLAPILTLENRMDFEPYAYAGGNTVAFSPDGSQLAAVADRESVKIWDANRGELEHTLAGRNGDISSVAFDSSGKRLVTANGGGQAMVWDVTTGGRLLTVTLPGYPANNALVASFTPDGKQLVTGGIDGFLRFWDIESRPAKELFSLSYYENPSYLLAYDSPRSISFSPDGKYLAVGTCLLGIVWDFQRLQTDPSNRPLFTLHGHQNCINGLSYSADGSRLITGSSDGTAKVWDAATGRELFSLAAGLGSIYSLALSPDGIHALSAHQDGSVAVWDISPGGSREWWEVYPASFGHISKDGKRLMTGFLPQGLMQLWELSPSGVKPIHTIQQSDALAQIYTIGYDAGLTLYARTGIDLRTSFGEPLPITLLDPATGRLVQSLIIKPTHTSNGHIRVVTSMDFNPDKTRLATAGQDGRVFVWDLASGRMLLKLFGHEDAVLDITYSPDGRLVATGSKDGTARIWDATTGQLLQILSGHSDSINDVDFSPDGTRLLTASSDTTVQIWDLQTGRALLTLRGHSTAVLSVDFSPDGTRIATGSEDNVATVWDASTGQALLTLPGTIVEFTPDGKRLMVISSDYVAQGYFLDVHELMDLARSRLLRKLTLEECQKYLHLDACPAQDN